MAQKDIPLLTAKSIPLHTSPWLHNGWRTTLHAGHVGATCWSSSGFHEAALRALRSIQHKAFTLGATHVLALEIRADPWATRGSRKGCKVIVVGQATRMEKWLQP